MKKTVLSGIFLASLFLIAIVSGCKKEDATNAPSNVGSAILSGNVQASLNDTTAAWENVPAGTKIIAVINSQDLVTNPEPGVTYDKISYETTVDGSGNYTFTNIAAANKDVTVTLYPVDFVYNQIQAGNTTHRKIYTVAPNPVTTVIKGTTKYLDIYYN